MEPITTELRKLMAHTVDGFDLNRPLVECDRTEFERLCDQIDAVHEGLERENDRLKVELDRALGELDDMHKSCEVSNKTTTFMHSGMSITHELREYAHDCCARVDDAIHAIADRIDAEYESKVGCTADEWDFWESTHIELPKDADGEHIRIGDELDVGFVERIVITDDEWPPYLYAYKETPYILTQHFCNEVSHYHTPTVEDLLREMADRIYADEDEPRDRDAIVAEYAKRLTLAEGEDA